MPDECLGKHSLPFYWRFYQFRFLHTAAPGDWHQVAEACGLDHPVTILQKTEKNEFLSTSDYFRETSP